MSPSAEALEMPDLYTTRQPDWPLCILRLKELVTAVGRLPVQCLPARGTGM